MSAFPPHFCLFASLFHERTRIIEIYSGRREYSRGRTIVSRARWLTTGAGIGFEIVKLAASIGSKVVVADLKLNEQAEAFVKSQDEKDLVFQRCDVTKRADLERLVEVAEEKWGEIPDVYMASAGVFEPVSRRLPFLPSTTSIPSPTIS